MGERRMGLLVSVQAVRELISEGDYVVESIEQREHGRLAVTLALRSRSQPYIVQIETGEHKLEGLFRALLNGVDAPRGRKPHVKVGRQMVPVIEVEAMPADQPKRRRRRVENAAAAETPEPRASEKLLTRTKRRRSAIRQLVLVPQEAPQRPAQMPEQPRQRTRSRPSSRAKNP